MPFAANTQTPGGASPAVALASAVAATPAVEGTPAVRGTPAVGGTPAVMATSAATPAPATLLKYTQPANLLTSSPLAATPASRQQGADGSPTHAADVALQARPQAAGMHAPSQATQNTEASHSCTCPCFA